MRRAGVTPPTEIVIADRSSPQLEPLREAIEREGMQVSLATSTLQLRRLLMMRSNLVIIDAHADPEEAISLCRQIRANSTVPIMLLLPPERPDLILSALGAGADDCISIPPALAESVARIHSLLRRASFSYAPRRTDNLVLTFASYTLDPAERVLLDPDGAIVNLTAAEFDLLLAFCRNPGRVMGREELLALTHAGLGGPVRRSIDVHVSRLRRKIERNPRIPVLLKTVRLGGYVFVADVKSLTDVS